MPQTHLYERVAASLGDWMDEASTKLSDGMKEGGRAPFSADATQAERHAYYQEQFFNPDGSPNMQGRMAEIARLGEAGFAKALLEVGEARKARMQGPAGDSVGGDVSAGM